MVNDRAFNFIASRLCVSIAQVAFAVGFGGERVIAESTFVRAITVVGSEKAGKIKKMLAC